MSLPMGYVGTDYLRLLEERMLDLKLRNYTLMNIEMRDSVLDVGCGPGSDTIHLAQHVGAKSEVTGWIMTPPWWRRRSSAHLKLVPDVW